jgi:hypothetical protein
MDGVAGELREAEARATGQSVSPDDLYREGRVKGAKAWHYQVETGILMNGSLTAKDINPTELDIPTVIRCVVRGLQNEGAKVVACC